MSAADVETFKLANQEAQNRILEPTKNIQEHVQVFNKYTYRGGGYNTESGCLDFNFKTP